MALTAKLGDCETNLDLKIKERDSLNKKISELEMTVEALNLAVEQNKKSCEVTVQKVVDQNLVLKNQYEDMKWKYESVKDNVKNLSKWELLKLLLGL